MIENFCTQYHVNLASFFCYLAAIIVGLIISIIDLSGKYGAGNSTKHVLIGWPQSFYYFANGAAGGFGLFASEVTEQTHIVQKFGTSPGLAIFQAMMIGVAAMLALRSSVFSINPGSEQTKVDVGPAQIVNMLMRYIERQVDKNRSTVAIKELGSVIKGIKVSDIYPNVLVCLLAAETIDKEAMEKARKDIEQIMLRTDLGAEAKSLAVCLVIHKEFGLQTLEAVLGILAKPNCVDVQSGSASGEAGATGGEPPAASPAVQLDADLDVELEKLKSKDKGAE